MENEARRKLEQEVADFYEAQGKNFSQTRQANWPIFKLLERELKPGSTVVDVGCGNGRLLNVLSPGINYIGLEPSSSLLAEARKRFSNRPGVVFKPGSLPKLDLPNESADAVVCIAVMHHIPSLEQRAVALAEILRILKPGGIFICSVWNLRASRFFNFNTFLHAWLRDAGVPRGERGDMYMPWKMEGADAKRYVHAFTSKEWKELFDLKRWNIQEIGPYDNLGWCRLSSGRNLVAICKKK
ncbi:MAG: methyltransferase domain-containing protein [Patescibacteria group bacterium]|jgi:ubiquinone/menaquinone biosynthesis C-methylase UbiE